MTQKKDFRITCYVKNTEEIAEVSMLLCNAGYNCIVEKTEVKNEEK